MRSRQGRSTRCVVAALALASVVLTACTGSDDEQPEGLTDIRDTEPREDDDAQPEADEPDPADEVSDEPEATDAGDDPDNDRDEDDGNDDSETATNGEDGSDTSEEEGDGDDGSDVEVDDEAITAAGVVVPDDAFQINDEIELDEDTQREYLQFSIDAYLYTTEALNTGEWDPDELARYYAVGELERNLSGFERYEEDGLRQVNDGTVVDRIRVTRWDGGGMVVHQCVTRGADDGVIDVQTGEYTFQSDERQRSLTISLALVEIADDRFDYRIVEIENGAEDECK